MEWELIQLPPFLWWRGVLFKRKKTSLFFPLRNWPQKLPNKARLHIWQKRGFGKTLIKSATICVNKCCQVSGKEGWHTCAKGHWGQQLLYWMCELRGSQAAPWEMNCSWKNRRHFCPLNNYTKSIPWERLTSFQNCKKLGVSRIKRRQNPEENLFWNPCSWSSAKKLNHFQSQKKRNIISKGPE